MMKPHSDSETVFEIVDTKTCMSIEIVATAGTGAALTVIPSWMAKSLTMDPPPDNYSLLDESGHDLQTVGVLEMDIWALGKVTLQLVYVCRLLDSPLISLTACEELGLVPILQLPPQEPNPYTLLAAARRQKVKKRVFYLPTIAKGLESLPATPIIGPSRRPPPPAAPHAVIRPSERPPPPSPRPITAQPLRRMNSIKITKKNDIAL